MVWSRAILAISFAVVLSAPDGSPAESSPTLGKIGAGVHQALEAAADARVFVFFSVPATPMTDMVERQRVIRGRREAIVSSVGAGIQNLDVVRELKLIPGFALRGSREAIVALAAHPDVVRIDIEGTAAPLLVEVADVMRTTEAEALGYRGAGVVVAVVDTGIDATHNDLQDSIIAEACFCSTNGGCCRQGATSEVGPGSAEEDPDHGGHGTWVTGVVTSNGDESPMGLARDASIVAVKVSRPDPTGMDSHSDYLAGLDWLLLNRPDVDVVNMSLGGKIAYPADCDDETSVTMAYAAAINEFRDRGVPVFVASGNGGCSSAMVAPACIANAISVAASYDSMDDPSPTYATRSECGVPSCDDEVTTVDQMACFSDRSPTTDLAAPGTATVTTHLGGGETPQALWGTSVAAPAAAACAALLLERSPGMLPDDLEQRLESSPVFVSVQGDPGPDPVTRPRLDCAAALAIPDTNWEVVLLDDFNDGNSAGWTAVDADGAASAWTVSGGELQGTGDAKNTSNGGAHDSALIADAIFGPDIQLQLDVRYISGFANPGDGFSGDNAFYVLLRYVDPLNYIYLKINPVDNCSACGNGPDITIKEVVAGTVSSLDVVGIYPAGVPPSNPSSVVSRLRVQLVDLRITLHWNDALVYDQFLPFVNRAAGRIGVGVPDGDSAATAGVSQFDNVFVTQPECADGVDNDGDGLFDFGPDPGCRDLASNREAPACDDELDNDEDGDTDSADSDCAADWRESEEPQPGLSRDDFEDGDLLGWTPSDSDGDPSFWTVSGGELQGTGDGSNSSNSGQHDSIILADAMFDADVTFEADVRYIAGFANPGDGFSGDNAFYVLLRYVDPLNYIYLKVNPVDNCSACGNGPDITIEEVVDGGVSQLGVVGIFPAGVPPGNPGSVVSHIKAELIDLRLILHWNGQLVFDQFLPFVNRGSGGAGVGVPDGSSPQSAGVSQFDNIRLLPEPRSGSLVAGILAILLLRNLRAFTRLGGLSSPSRGDTPARSS